MFGIEDFSKKIVDFGNFEFSQLGDAFIFGGAIVLIGMLTIFSVLIILWGCLSLFKIVFHDLSNKKNSVPKTVEINIAPIAPVQTATTDDGEIIAAIAAAIAMAESENSDVKFRVVSFRRK